MALISEDGLGRVAIVRRTDGLFCLYSRCHLSFETQKALGLEDPREIRWTTDFDIHFYAGDADQGPVPPLPGIFDSLESAEKEALQILRLNDS